MRASLVWHCLNWIRSMFHTFLYGTSGQLWQKLIHMLFEAPRTFFYFFIFLYFFECFFFHLSAGNFFCAPRCINGAWIDAALFTFCVYAHLCAHLYARVVNPLDAPTPWACETLIATVGKNAGWLQSQSPFNKWWQRDCVRIKWEVAIWARNSSLLD